MGKLALRRRGSLTSQTSSKGSQILPAITKRKEILSGDPADEQRLLQQRHADLERIERFSLNLPGDACSDDSDLDADAEKGVTQSTQTRSVWEVATQTSPSLSLLRPLTVNNATQMTPSSSVPSSPELVRKKPVTSVKCHRERGQGDGSPNGSSSELSDHVTVLGSPTQSLLDYLLPIKKQCEGADDAAAKSRSQRSKNTRSRDARAVEAIELDRSSIARLLDKLREDNDNDDGNKTQTAANDGEDRPKRSYDRRARVERSRRSQSERNDGNDVELDYLLGSKNSNRSDRSRKSRRSKQDSTADLEDS